MGEIFTFGTILTVVIMVAALIGMFICAKKQQVYQNAQTFAFVLLAIVIACGITILFQTGVLGSANTEKLIAKEMLFAKAKATVLGQSLAASYPGLKTLLIVEPGYEKNENQKQLIAALKEGFGSKIPTVVIASPEVPPMPAGTPPEMMMRPPLEEMMQAKQFDAIINKYPDCKLIVTLIGLPFDVGEMELWRKDEAVRPKVALFNGEIYELKGAIMQKLIVAAVAYKPGAKFTESPTKDIKKDFDLRYVLLTPANVEAEAAKNPGLFK
ncbi:MAG: hypothetical protein A2X49_14800 [Lentisphaerae bacterium GWF2_52_8]|nr:MAG: hypothetical protein A2X49_14800 [Lentisphaerae bacterium GWF2_52_8]